MTPEPPDDWRPRAACADTPLLMFPTTEPGVLAAKRICRGCPVIQECGEDALRMEAMPGVGSHGVRGGMAAKRRRRMLNEGWSVRDGEVAPGELPRRIDRRLLG